MALPDVRFTHNSVAADVERNWRKSLGRRADGSRVLVSDLEWSAHGDRGAVEALALQLSTAPRWLSDVELLADAVARLRAATTARKLANEQRRTVAQLERIGRRWGGQSAQHRLLFAAWAVACLSRLRSQIVSMCNTPIVLTDVGSFAPGDGRRRQRPDARSRDRWERGAVALLARADGGTGDVGDRDALRRLLDETASVVAPSPRVATRSPDRALRAILEAHAERVNVSTLSDRSAADRERRRG